MLALSKKLYYLMKRKEENMLRFYFTDAGTLLL